jgi:hypothetical protein
MTDTARPRSERRRHPRQPIARPARIRPNEWSRIEIEVIDFSPDGFRGRCAATLRVGSYINVEVPGTGNVQAKVIWRHDGEFGACFLVPVDPAHCGWIRPEPEALSSEAPVPEEARDVARMLAARVTLGQEASSEDRTSH